jgi:hypothetical protein
MSTTTALQPAPQSACPPQLLPDGASSNASNESWDVSEAETLLTKGSCETAGSLALAILVHSQAKSSPSLRERCLHVVIQAGLHMQSTNTLDGAVQQAGGVPSLPCRAFLLLCLANLQLGRALLVEQHVKEYLQHPGSLVGMSPADHVAVHRLMAVEVYCKARHDHSTALRWLHNAPEQLPRESLAPLLAAVEKLQDAAGVRQAVLAPSTPPGPFMTFTGSLVEFPASAAQQAPADLLGALRAAKPGSVLQACLRRLQLRSCVVALKGAWAWAARPECWVLAAMLYAVLSERKWLRTVLGGIVRQQVSLGRAVKGAVWDSVRMALAMSPNPAGSAPLAMQR